MNVRTIEKSNEVKAYPNNKIDNENKLMDERILLLIMNLSDNYQVLTEMRNIQVKNNIRK